MCSSQTKKFARGIFSGLDAYAWLDFDSDMTQLWFRHDSTLIQTWLDFDSDMTRLWLDMTRLKHDSTLIQTWHDFDLKSQMHCILYMIENWNQKKCLKKSMSYVNSIIVWTILTFMYMEVYHVYVYHVYKAWTMNKLVRLTYTWTRPYNIHDWKLKIRRNVLKNQWVM